MTIVSCTLCDGVGATGAGATVVCPRCEGTGRIAQRSKPVVPSATRVTFFRGARVTNAKRKTQRN
jgi:DnaJ-class molecular chaperone